MLWTDSSIYSRSPYVIKDSEIPMESHVERTSSSSLSDKDADLEKGEHGLSLASRFDVLITVRSSAFSARYHRYCGVR